MTARAPLTAIPDDFGVGGSHLVPGGSSGEPSLRDVLREHVTAIHDLQGETGDDFSVARFATTANLNLATTGLTAVDGVTPIAGDKALVKNQTTASQNGLYIVSAGAWARLADDAGSTTLAEGLTVSVAEGSTNGSKLFVLGSDLTTWTAGTTASLSSSSPANVAAAAVIGVAVTAARGDHAHADPNRGVAGAALGDTSPTITISQGTWRKLPVSTLTADRTVTLGTAGAVAGDQIEITRLDLTAHQLIIVDGGPGTPTLYTMAVSKLGCAKFQFDGTNWFLRSFGVQ